MSSTELQDALSKRKARLAELRSKVSKNKTNIPSNLNEKGDTISDNKDDSSFEQPQKRIKIEEEKVGVPKSGITTPNITTIEDKSSKIEAEALAKYAKLAEKISKGYLPNANEGNEIKHEVELDDYDVGKVTKYYSDDEIIEEFEDQLSDDFHYLKHLTDSSIKRITRERLLKLKVEDLNDK